MDPVAPPKIQAKGKRGGVRGGAGQAREPMVVGEWDNNAGTSLEDINLGMKGLEVVGDESHTAQEIWTKVLYVAPSFAGVEGEKLRRISGEFRPRHCFLQSSFRRLTFNFRFGVSDVQTCRLSYRYTTPQGKPCINRFASDIIHGSHSLN